MQPDLKKLITAFLGVALLSSAFSLAFMHSGAFQNENGTSNANGGLTQEQRNAFADISLVTPPWRTSQAFSTSEPDIFTSSNLTENFSQALSNGVFEAANKEKAFDQDSLSRAVEKIQSRIFEEPQVPLRDIQMNDKASWEEKVGYVKSVRDIIKETAENPLYKNLGTTKLDTEQTEALKTLFEKQRGQIVTLKVPKVMVPLHKALLSYNSGNQKFFEGLGAYEKDPVKTLLMLQHREELLGGYATKLIAELDNVGPALKVSYLEENKPSWIQDSVLSLFAPKVAYATAPVIDYSNLANAIASFIGDAIKYAKDAAHFIKTELDAALKWVQTQLEWAEKLATEQLKNVLVQLMVRASVAWVNGDGSPQFVTNWRVYTDDAFGLGVGKGLDEISDETCGMFGPSMIRQLGDSYNTFYRPSNCRQTETGRALSTFRNNNFQDGGWGAYGVAVSPRGNYFQSYARNAEKIDQSAEKEAEAAISDAMASNGYKPTKDCPEYARQALSSEDSASSPAEGGEFSTDPLPDGSCPDGSEPQNTTPGAIIGEVANKAFTIPGDRIVTSQNLISLGFTLANGALTKVMTAKNKGLTSLNDGAALGAAGENASYNLADTCSRFASGTPGRTDCLNNVGAAEEVQTNLDLRNASTSRQAADDQALSNLKSDADSIAQNINSTISINTETMSVINELTVDPDLLGRVIHICGNLGLSEPGQERIPEARSLQADLAQLGQNIPGTNVDRDLMAAHLSILNQSRDANLLPSLFTQFTTNYGTVASTTDALSFAQNRRVAVRQIKVQAEATIAKACDPSTPFSTSTIPALIQNP